MEGARWAVRLSAWSPSRAEWLLSARCVQPEEKERIQQFMFNRDAKAAMVGRLLIRKLLCVKTGLPWDGFRLARTVRGKPYLSHPSPVPGSAHWSFNISHQGDFAVLAAERGRQVGVDVMKTTKPGSGSVQEFFRIMKRQFTDHEWSSITSAQSEWEQLHMFYRHWALKESFIKAIGTGLGFDLQRVEFRVSPGQMREGLVYRQTIVHLDGEEEDDWTFEECLMDEHHHVAVALGKPDGSVPDNAGISEEATSTPFTLLSFTDLVAEAKPLADEDPAYWEDFKGKREAPGRQSDAQ
ncbi:L-aminoadipate-semialdehyde dehydrogenase-phosphopantetheinyl transferase [Trichomycterus rosablanca]|uniref:L-aminoadipate-semialdehyde dehydrogenase-phosphopantetheinyl transferase n=1 Tax=Trichomycterus rosablanca TaxID=2290929 RepID=UPI002F35D210